MSTKIELTTADAGTLQGIREAIGSATPLSSVPATIQPTELVIVNGTLWTGLADGTPWPARGYKLYKAVWGFYQSDPFFFGASFVNVDELGFDFFTTTHVNSRFTTVADWTYGDVKEIVTCYDSGTGYSFTAVIEPFGGKLTTTFLEKRVVTEQGERVTELTFDPSVLSGYDLSIPVEIKVFPPAS